MLYVLENNGVYGLTKGQFSASADVGSKSKKGEPNVQRPIDPVLLALTLGATFVARSFSGDKAQLVPLLKAGLQHGGFALVDVISPCVTFNDHDASTKSYLYTRQHYREVAGPDFVPLQRSIKAEYDAGEQRAVKLHGGSSVLLRKIEEGYDRTDRAAAYRRVREAQERGEILTGLLYLDEAGADMHALNNTVETPLTEVPYETLCPGSVALARLMEDYR